MSNTNGNQQGAYPAQPYTDSGNGTLGPPPPPRTTNYASNGGPPPPRQQPTWLRFVKTLAIAVLVYALIGMLAESTYLAAKYRAWHQNRLPDWYDLPDNVKVFECTTSNAWSKTSPTVPISSGKTVVGPLPPWRYPFASNISFDVSLGSGGANDDTFLLFLSRGRWLTGEVTIVSGGTNKKGYATVNVEVGYAREDTRDKVRACLIEREDGAKGVGIFTPKYEGSSVWVKDDHARQIHHQTTIILPDDRPGPLNVQKLETDLPNSSLRIEAFGVWNHFKDVLLKGSGGMIDAGPDLTAERVTINATDAPVIGNIFVTKELNIDTSNGSVEARVVLDYRQEQDNTPKMDIKTSNGVIETEVHLLSDVVPPIPADAHKRGYKKPPTPHFEIKAATSNARLNVGIHHAALERGDPVIHFEGTTSNAVASALLFQTYSGAYEVEATNNSAKLQLSCPEFRQREECRYGFTAVREEIVKKDHLKGEMEWTRIVTIPEPTGKPLMEVMTKKKKLESSVVLRTSNAPAVLGVSELDMPWALAE